MKRGAAMKSVKCTSRRVPRTRDRAQVPADSKPPMPTSTVQKRLVTANRWRDQFNPLRGLDIKKVVSLLDQYRAGNYAHVLWTMLHVEQLDCDVIGLIERRTSAIKQLDWNIKIVPKDRRTSTFDQVLAEEQQKFLREAYDRFKNLYAAIDHLAMASFRGFAHVQPQLVRPGAEPRATLFEPNHLECLSQWNFVRDGVEGAWFWNPDFRSQEGRSMPAELQLDPFGLLIREKPRPLNRVALLKFVRANLSEKDWDAFIEIYGLAEPDVVAPQSVTDEPTMQKFRDAIAEKANGSGGVYPSGTELIYPSEMRGNSPFEQRLRYLSEKLILAGTGGMLTMLTAPGSGTLAGSAHQEAFDSIARSEAREISEVFQKHHDLPRLEAAFPGQPILAYWELAAQEEQDVGEIIDHDNKLAAGGRRIATAALAEKTGYTIELNPAAPSVVPATPAPAVGTPAAPAGTGPGVETVTDTALNGAQVASLLEIVQQVALQTLPSETAVGIIAAAFPTMGEEQIRKILAPLGNFTQPKRLADRAPAAADPAKAGELLAAARIELPPAQHRLLAKVAKPLIELYRRSEEEDWAPERIAQEMEAFGKGIPELLQGEDSPTIAVFQRLIGTAMAEGLAGGAAP